MPKYRITLVWSEQDGWWIATVPELPWTAADGKTPEEAVRNVQPLIADWLADAKLNGWAIPEPVTYEPIA